MLDETSLGVKEFIEEYRGYKIGRLGHYDPVTREGSIIPFSFEEGDTMEQSIKVRNMGGEDAWLMEYLMTDPDRVPIILLRNCSKDVVDEDKYMGIMTSFNSLKYSRLETPTVGGQANLYSYVGFEIAVVEVLSRQYIEGPRGGFTHIELSCAFPENHPLVVSPQGGMLGNVVKAKMSVVINGDKNLKEGIYKALAKTLVGTTDTVVEVFV